MYAQKTKDISVPMALVPCQKKSESTAIIKTSGRPEPVKVLRHRILGCWAVYHVRLY